MVYCSKCGEENDNSYNSCVNCGSILMKREYSNLKSFNSFEKLFIQENLNILENATLTEEEYNLIIDNIIKMGDYNLEKLSNNIPNNVDILTKIMLITKSYAKINYKSKGAELGSYAFNCINVDDRLDNANQISTLIHELSHHLLAEIFEQVLMYIFEVKKTDELESFAHLTLATLPSALMNEYCAHTVEGRFIPHGYQNYGSFNNLLSENFDPEKDQEMVIVNLLLGNSFSEDIIRIVEHFIDSDLREEIKVQFKKDYNFPPKYDEILLEKKEIMDFGVKIGLMFSLFRVTFEIASTKESKEILDYLNENYAKFNRL